MESVKIVKGKKKGDSANFKEIGYLSLFELSSVAKSSITNGYVANYWYVFKMKGAKTPNTDKVESYYVYNMAKKNISGVIKGTILFIKPTLFAVLCEDKKSII